MALSLFDPLFDNELAEMDELFARVDAEDAARQNEHPDALADKSEFAMDLVAFHERLLNGKNRIINVRSQMRLPRHVREEDAERVPCITATYEDRFLRAPRNGELQCMNNTSCIGLSPNIPGYHKHHGKILVEFRTPDLVQRDRRGGNLRRTPNLCVLCTRHAVATMYFKSLPGNGGDSTAAFVDQINEYCNAVDIPDGYRAEVTLPPPCFSATGFDTGSAHTRLVGSVCFLKFSLLEWKQDENEEWWIDQSRCKYISPRTVCIAPKNHS